LSKFIICHYYNYVYDTKRESHGVLLNPMIFHPSRPEEFSFSLVCLPTEITGCFDDLIFQLSGLIIDFHFHDKVNLILAHPHIASSTKEYTTLSSYMMKRKWEIIHSHMKLNFGKSLVYRMPTVLSSERWSSRAFPFLSWIIFAVVDKMGKNLQLYI